MVRILAFAITTILRMRATMATILGLPLLTRRSKKARMAGSQFRAAMAAMKRARLRVARPPQTVLRPRVHPAVARMRGAAGEAGGGAPIDAAEFGHAGLEDKGGLTSNARDRGKRVEAGLEAGIGGDDLSGARLEASDFAVQRCPARRRASGPASCRRKGAGGSDWSRPCAWASRDARPSGRAAATSSSRRVNTAASSRWLSGGGR